MLIASLTCAQDQKQEVAVLRQQQLPELMASHHASAISLLLSLTLEAAAAAAAAVAPHDVLLPLTPLLELR